MYSKFAFSTLNILHTLPLADVFFSCILVKRLISCALKGHFHNVFNNEYREKSVGFLVLKYGGL